MGDEFEDAQAKYGHITSAEEAEMLGVDRPPMPDDNVTCFTCASRPLAEEVNPVTLEAMRQANVGLERRQAVLQAVFDAESELRRAVHEWFMREETDLVVGFLEDGEDFPVTLSWLRENDKLALHYWVFESVVTSARFPRYLCESCRDPGCGGTYLCGESGQAAESVAGGDTEKYNDYLLKARMPARVKTAMALVVRARGRATETAGSHQEES